MQFEKKHFPEIDKASLEHSKIVTKFIAHKITATAKQRITFADFMHLALYAPGLGYYTSGTHKLGKNGDFVTAPEISPLFSQCLAQQCAQVLQSLAKGGILEFGAGTGKMAADILLTLENLQQLPEFYFILEVSPDLRARQKQTIHTQCPHLANKVCWLDSLPQQPINGIILANEVVDAMPVHRFLIDNALLQEYYVTVENERFAWVTGALSQPRLQHALRKIQDTYFKDFSGRYVSEVNLMVQPWLQSLSDTLAAGLILLIDYGFPAAEYYHLHRNEGTLMCHLRHHAHDDPLIFPGIQDITAHVDFSLIAGAALNAGLEIAGYTAQANFLINCGLADLIHPKENLVEMLDVNKQIKLLTLPSEMGELFKIIGLSRKIEIPLTGFSSGDRRHQL